ncbi:hypothetical protein G4O51_10785 [Candidatus Bathyarchaeota archaeon A05DMB-2]|jgi:hypothetical protein|nr:hypothetical protein [Candidatus Bathyarchaeota archaeon A05DMB-2]
MPNPVGVGQEVLVWLGITDYVQNQSCGWEGLTVTVTKPDGSTKILDNNGKGFRTAATGSTGTVYVPATVGNYTFQTHFPQQWFSHILWSKPLATGGFSGGFLGDHSAESGDAYEGKFANTVIINGILSISFSE